MGKLAGPALMEGEEVLGMVCAALCAKGVGVCRVERGMAPKLQPL